MTRFERDTALAPIAPGRWHARLDDAWRIALGPNGGYLAAIMLRAIEASVGDAARVPRSLTVHYVSRPEGAEAEIVTTEERAGRSLTTVGARMVQDGRPIAVALAALSRARDCERPVALDHARFPDVIPLARAERWHSDAASPAARFHGNFEMRWALPEKPHSGSPTARSAAWVRLAEPMAPDAALLALLADSLPPAIFAVAHSPGELGPVPTIDLSIHFRAPLALARVAPDDFLLLHFATRLVADGFLDEDGEIWTRDGVLLAQSRQLAILA